MIPERQSHPPASCAAFPVWVCVVARRRSSRPSAHPSAARQIAAWIVSWLIRRVGSSGCMVRSLHAICSGDAACGGPACPAQSHAATPLDQLLPPSAPLAARPVSVPAKLRAMRPGGVSSRTATPQFPPDGRGAAPQQCPDRPKARPAPKLRHNHATFLAIEVLVSFVHRNIPCPLGGRCRTSNLSLSVPSRMIT